MIRLFTENMSNDVINFIYFARKLFIMETNQHHVCPWWLGYFLISPVRKFKQNPNKILSPYIKTGMQIIDFGCAMGYFSIPLARLTGPNGKVFCVDIQEKMLQKLKKRTKNKRMEGIIEPRLIGKDYNPAELQNRLDFVLLFSVVHEVPDKEQLFRDMYAMLMAGGKVLFSEPDKRVPINEFESSIQLAEKAGFKQAGRLNINKSHSVLFEKN